VEDAHAAALQAAEEPGAGSAQLQAVNTGRRRRPERPFQPPVNNCILACLTRRSPGSWYWRC
jgi:hypothetical protein